MAKKQKTLAQVLAEMNQPKKPLLKEDLDKYEAWKKEVRAAYPKAEFDKEGDEYINSATFDGVEVGSFEDGEGFVAPVDADVDHVKADDSEDDFKFDEEEAEIDEAKKKDDAEPEDEEDKEKVKEVKQDSDKEDDAESDDLDISGDDDATEKAKDSMGDDEDAEADEFSFADLADDEDAGKEDKDAEEDADADIDDLESDDDKEDKEVKGKDKEADDEVTVVVVSPDHDLDADKEDDEDKKKPIKEFSMDEHVSALLQGETLSEEFKEKTRTIFEAALNEAIKSHKEKVEAKLLEKYNKKLASVKDQLKEKSLNESKKVQDAMIQSVDGFLTSEAKKWTKENRVALEKNIRADLAEGFIDGLKTLFTESYIDVPQEKFDVIAAQEETIKQLEESLAKSKQNNTKLIREGVKLQRAAILNECIADLTDTQKVKMEKLVESVEFEKPSDFRKQVTLIKESYFTEKEVPNIARKQLIEEVEIEVEATPVSGPARQTVGYVAAIDRLFKQS